MNPVRTRMMLFGELVLVEWRDGDVFCDAPCECGGHPRCWTAARLRAAWGRG